jgi:hypothetical protein
VFVHYDYYWLLMLLNLKSFTMLMALCW